MLYVHRTTVICHPNPNWQSPNKMTWQSAFTATRHIHDSSLRIIFLEMASVNFGETGLGLLITPMYMD